MSPQRTLCAYKGCYNSKAKNPDLQFHRFPTDASRLNDWIICSGNIKLIDFDAKQMTNQRICSKHFRNNDYVETIQIDKKKLKKFATPIDSAEFTDLEILENIRKRCFPDQIDLPLDNIDSANKVNIDLPSLIASNVPFEFTEPCSIIKNTLNSDVLICKSKTAMYKNLIMRLTEEKAVLEQKLFKQHEILRNRESHFQKLKQQYLRLSSSVLNKNQTIKNLERNLDNYKKVSSFYEDFNKLNENVMQFFKMQVNHVTNKPWTNDEKLFAISLFCESPKAYCFLRDENKFALPHVNHIKNWVSEDD